jgi:hypothetical protein
MKNNNLVHLLPVMLLLAGAPLCAQEENAPAADCRDFEATRTSMDLFCYNKLQISGLNRTESISPGTP